MFNNRQKAPSLYAEPPSDCCSPTRNQHKPNSLNLAVRKDVDSPFTPVGQTRFKNHHQDLTVPDEQRAFQLKNGPTNDMMNHDSDLDQSKYSTKRYDRLPMPYLLEPNGPAVMLSSALETIRDKLLLTNLDLAPLTGLIKLSPSLELHWYRIFLWILMVFLIA